MRLREATFHHAIVFDLGGVVVDWQPRYLYQMLIADPTRSIYIDDNPTNVDAAAQLGLDALFFSSPGQLAADLTQRGALKP